MRDYSELKKKGVTRCKKCRSMKSYTNPTARCFECREQFCYDHIRAGQVNGSMKDTDRVRDVCENCILAKGYRDMD